MFYIPIIMPITLDILFEMLLVCAFQFTCLSNVIPRKENCST